MPTEWGRHLKASNKNGNKNGSPKRIYHHSRRMKTKEHDRKEQNATEQ